MEVFHQGEPRTKIDAFARQQTLIQEHEGWRAQTHEFQGGQTIRSDGDLIACPLRKQLSKPGGNSAVILNKKQQLYGGWFIEDLFLSLGSIPHSK